MSTNDPTVNPPTVNPPTSPSSAAPATAATSDPPGLPILELGPGWPGWVPRVVLLLAGLGASFVLLGDNVNSIAFGFILALALVVPLVPATPAPAILIGAVAVAVAASSGDALRPAVLLEIPLLHLVHVTASFAGLVPVRAVIRPAALWRPARRFLVVQALTFAVVAVAELLPTGRDPIVVEIAGLVASTGLVAVAIWLVARRQ